MPVTTYDMDENEGTTRLWLLPSSAKGAGSGGAEDPARAVTAADASSDQPTWSPDGSRLAFARKPKGKKEGGKKKSGPKHTDMPQLYLFELGGGEPERLTDLPFGVSSPQWFPDGRRIAFLSPVYADAPALEETAKRKAQREQDPLSVYVTEDRFFRFWDRWLTDGRVHHIFIFDLATRELMDLTPESRRHISLAEGADQFSVAPDGKEIAFSACKTDPPYDTLVWGIFALKVPARVRSGARVPAPRPIAEDQPGHTFRPVYSPDGATIVYGMRREIDFYADRVRLVGYNRATRKSTVLTEGWDLSASGWTFGEDSGTLHLVAEVEARTAIFALDLRAAIRNPKRAEPRELVRGGAFSAPRVAGSRVFATRSSLREPPEVFSVRANGTGLAQLTAFTRIAMLAIEPSQVEEMRFAGAGGDEVQMFVLYPPGSRRRGRTRRRYPLVHLIHGGPHGVWVDGFHWRWNAQAFAAAGYLVALVNFHGSTSWGHSFTQCIEGRWGDQPYRDIMAATDRLIELGLADERRMAAVGGSYGGYLAAWIASQTDRFACVVNHAGVSDFQAQYATDVTQGRRRAHGGEPWDGIDRMDRYNPMRHASGFRTPMLVIHGEKDYRVPSALGIEIYNLYKARKLPARLVYYADEHHWILKPKNGIHWYGEVLSWLKRWLRKRRRRKV